MAVRIEIDGLVATLVLDNPPLNVVTDAVRAGLVAGLAECEARHVRAVVLIGAGERAFCAGADLGNMADGAGFTTTSGSVTHSISRDATTILSTSSLLHGK